MRKAHPAFEQLSAYHDGEAGDDQFRIAGHLRECGACRGMLAGFDRLSAVLFDAPALTCAAARPLISAQLDGEVGPQESRVANAHLAACADCSDWRAGALSFDAALRRLSPAAPSASADARIRGLARRPVLPRLGPTGGVAVRAAVAVALAVAVVVALPTGGVTPLAVPQERALVAAAQQVAFNSRTNILYSLDIQRGVVVARNASTSELLAEIPVGGAPSALALNDETNAVYVLDPGAKQVIEISGSTNSVTGSIPVPLTGRPTGLEVNAQSGKLVVGGSSASTQPASTTGQLAVIDSGTRTLDSVRDVDVSPSAVVLSPRSDRVYLLGAAGTSVLDATSYERIATLPAAVAVAPSATGGADAILREKDGHGVVSLFGMTTEVSVTGRPVTVVSLPDGGFAALVDIAGRGRIALFGADLADRGALDVPVTARQITFSPETGSFIGSSGQVLATVATGAVSRQSPSAQPEVSSTAPSVAAPSVVAPSVAAPSVAAPQTNPVAAQLPPGGGAPNPPLPTTKPAALPVNSQTAPPEQYGPIPGSVVAAGNMYRLALGDHTVAALAGSGARLWFADTNGRILAVDTESGTLSTVAELHRELRDVMLVVGSHSLFIVDRGDGSVTLIDPTSGRRREAIVPLRSQIVGAGLTRDEHLWLAAEGSPGLLDFNPQTLGFAFLALPTGGAATALATDLAGRIWFADGGRSTVGYYDSSFRRFVEFASPARGAVTRITADEIGQVWFGTDAGEVFAINGGILSSVRPVGGKVYAIAGGRGNAWYVAAGRPARIAASTGVSTTAPDGATLLAVDQAGRAWLAGPSLAAFFIVEAR